MCMVKNVAKWVMECAKKIALVVYVCKSRWRVPERGARERGAPTGRGSARPTWRAASRPHAGHASVAGVRRAVPTRPRGRSLPALD